jgi:hypothetical protein
VSARNITVYYSLIMKLGARSLNSVALIHFLSQQRRVPFFVMDDCLIEDSGLPTPAETISRQNAFKCFSQVILGDATYLIQNEELPCAFLSASRGSHMVNVQLGPDALDVWTTKDDMECLCISSMTNDTFISLCKQRLRIASSQGVLRLLRTPTGL